MNWLFLTALTIGAMAAQTSPPAPGLRVSMISLGVKDMARSVKFYAGTLGLQQSGPQGEFTFFQAGGVMIALNLPSGLSSGDKLAGVVEVIFPVESVAAAHQALAARGCRFVRGPREVTTGMWAATFTDPDGHELTLLGPR